MSKHTMPSFTPGPWIAMEKLSGSETHNGFRIMNGTQTWALADVQPGDEDGNIGCANAHLIASAPQLLEELEGCERYLSDLHNAVGFAFSGGRTEKMLAEVRAAIKAAKGE